ncbi:MAG: hypothetical protein ACOC44_02730 [Promethearchaeia archaeon]
MFQATFDTNSIIILATFFVIFGVFLFYDFFRKGERYGFLAYIILTLPINYLWYLSTDIPNVDVLTVYLILFILWDVLLLRDFIFVFIKTKEYDDILLFLGLGILFQLTISAVLPAEQLNPQLQENTAKFWYFWLPDIYTQNFGIESWINENTLLGFRAAATFMVILCIIPMLLDVKMATEKPALPILIIIDALFILPFLYLGYLWLPQSMAVFTLLLCVILFIVLLLMTKDEE